jgi:hypothetical protein
MIRLREIMPDKVACKTCRHAVGPVHHNTEGYRDHKARPNPVKDAVPAIGAIARDMKEENSATSTTGTTIVMGVLAAFAIYAIFYR